MINKTETYQAIENIVKESEAYSFTKIDPPNTLEVEYNGSVYDLLILHTPKISFLDFINKLLDSSEKEHYPTFIRVKYSNQDPYFNKWARAKFRRSMSGVPEEERENVFGINQLEEALIILGGGFNTGKYNVPLFIAKTGKFHTYSYGEHIIADYSHRDDVPNTSEILKRVVKGSYVEHSHFFLCHEEYKGDKLFCIKRQNRRGNDGKLIEKGLLDRLDMLKNRREALKRNFESAIKRLSSLDVLRVGLIDPSDSPIGVEDPEQAIKESGFFSYEEMDAEDS